MRVRAIRGSIMYDGIVYPEGSEFEIEEIHLTQIHENVEVLSGAKSKKNKEDTTQTSEIKPENENTSEHLLDYSKMKKEELINLAQEKGIEVQAKAKTAEIIELLEGAE